MSEKDPDNVLLSYIFALSEQQMQDASCRPDIDVTRTLPCKLIRALLNHAMSCKELASQGLLINYHDRLTRHSPDLMNTNDCSASPSKALLISSQDEVGMKDELLDQKESATTSSEDTTPPESTWLQLSKYIFHV